MKRCFPVLVVLLVLLAIQADARLRTQALSVNTTSQAYQLPSVSMDVGLCNQGTDLVYFELWTDNDVYQSNTAAATATSPRLPAGTAAAPYCKTYSHSRSDGGTGYLMITIVADSGTATVDVESK